MVDDVEHFNKLSPEVAELLAILAEECAEVVQMVGKVLRHGIRENPYTGILNRIPLEEELTDVMAVVDLLCRAKVLDWSRINDQLPAKFAKLSRPGILHHSTLLEPRPCCLCESTTQLQKGHPSSPRCLDEASCKERQRAQDKPLFDENGRMTRCLTGDSR